MREIVVAAFIAAWVSAYCQTADSRCRDYIERFAPVAMAEQEAHGIPASITLAQGILESASGRSALAREANNHFGIKCGSGWTGGTTLRSDDAPDECFRAYGSPEESFADHSRFLLRPRYAALFDLDVTDYAAWARMLRKCGYATDPNYAARLIAIIERYALYAFDSGGSLKAAEENAAFIMDTLRATHPIRRSRGLHYVVAAPGDTYQSIASELGLDGAVLARLNDAGCAECDIRPWEEVYLQEKLDSGPAGVKKATIGQDETMRTVAQRYGIRLARIVELNPKAADKPGTRLKLQ